MRLYEKHILIDPGNSPTISRLKELVCNELAGNEQIVRFVVSDSSKRPWRCEIGIVQDAPQIKSVFSQQSELKSSNDDFNVVLMIPTGIGCEIGGHAGDAGPIARLIGECADRVILHPNVVNGSDLNEMPENSWYVEGSLLTQFMMGQIGFQQKKNNRILTIIEDHTQEIFVNSAINSVNAACSSFGMEASEVVVLNPGLDMSASFSTGGSAVGQVNHLRSLFDALSARKDQYDAVAISSQIRVPHETYDEYFQSGGNPVNPWGGVEAMLTHSVSLGFAVPSAHSPMYESMDIAMMDPGVIDPRMAAEVISWSFLQCVLKGLMRAPKIVDHDQGLNAEDVSCLIIPDGCVGLPTLAALDRGTPVIAVRNSNIMKNNLSDLNWPAGQLHYASSYLEAAGLVQSMKAGLSPRSLKRPLESVRVTRQQGVVYPLGVAKGGKVKSGAV